MISSRVFSAIKIAIIKLELLDLKGEAMLGTDVKIFSIFKKMTFPGVFSPEKIELKNVKPYIKYLG
jgi:hypothetical protein